MRTRIMFIESKAEEHWGGVARIGRVTFSKSGRTIYYGGRAFQRTQSGGKANYFDIETGDAYWISGCKRDGGDRLYDERVPVEIDDDVRAEYWRDIRGLPEAVDRAVASV